MGRSCTTCQHLKRPEIDRRLAAGEPANRVARDYGLNPSSLQRHRANCLGLASSNMIKKEAARGTAAAALLPSKETLSGGYFDLCTRIDQIVAQAQQEGSLKVALAGLKSIRQNLDSLARLGGHTAAPTAQVNVAVNTSVQLDLPQISKCLLDAFDHEPETKAKIAAALISLDQQESAIASQEKQTVEAIATGVSSVVGSDGPEEISNAPRVVSGGTAAAQQQAAPAAARTSEASPSHGQETIEPREGDHHVHVRTTPDRV
jgi:hypothetical protein